MESRTKYAKRNISVGLISRLLLTLLPFVIRTVIIHTLGTLYLGLNSLFTSILQVLSLAELGFGDAMVFSMYDPIAKGRISEVRSLLNLYKSIYRIIGTAVFAIGLLLVPALPYMISGDTPSNINIYVIYIISLLQTGLSYFLFAYKSSLLVACQRYDIKTAVSLVVTVSQYILQIIVLYVTKNYYFYSILAIVSVVINNLIVEYITKKDYPEYFCDGEVPSQERKDIWKRVSGLFIYKVSGVFRNSFDSIIISSFLGLVILAQYQNYYYVLNAVTGFMSVLMTSITAGIGNSISIESEKKNYNDFNKFLYLFMGITSVCTVCLYNLYQPFISLWVGKDLVFDKSIMVIFCIYFFTTQMGNMCYVYRQAAGLWWQDKVRPVVEAVVNLTLNIVLVNFIGVSGVLLSTIICLVFINCIWGSWILFKYYFKEQKISSYILRLGGYALITFFACVISGFVCNLVETTGFLSLNVNGIISVLAGGVVFIIFSFVYPERKEAAKFVCNKILKNG